MWKVPHWRPCLWCVEIGVLISNAHRCGHRLIGKQSQPFPPEEVVGSGISAAVCSISRNSGFRGPGTAWARGPAITREIYTHMESGAQREAVERIGTLLVFPRCSGIAAEPALRMVN